MSGGQLLVPSDVMPLGDPDVDLIDAEVENRARLEALLTLHDLSESWWAGERRATGW